MTRYNTDDSAINTKESKKMGFDWSAVASAGSGLVGSILNFISAKKANEQNQKNYDKQFDYDAALTQHQWERDDNSHQREVADLQAAGLSPLASTSGALNSQGVGAPNPIAMQAPQVDTSAMVQGAIGAGQIEETKRHNMQVERQRDSELENDAARIANEAKSLELQNKKVEEEIRYQTELNRIAQATLDEKIRATKKDEELRLSAQESLDLERETKKIAQEIKSATGGKDIPVRYVYDVGTYQTYLKIRNIAYQRLIDELKATQSATGSSVGGNAGASVAGTGVNVGGHGSDYNSENISQRQQELINKFNEDYPIPVYLDKNEYKEYFKDRN